MTVDFEHVVHKGISNITPEDVAVAQELGYVIKLVGDIQETTSGIAPKYLQPSYQKSSPCKRQWCDECCICRIYRYRSVYVLWTGRWAKPTATSVMADIIRIVRRLKDNTIGKAFNEYSPLQLATPSDVKSEYYFSIDAPDKNGKMLRLAEIFNSEEISFKQILQQVADGETARLVIVTHEMSKTQLENVTDKLSKETDFTVLNTFKVLGE